MSEPNRSQLDSITHMAQASATIQTSSEPVPTVPPGFGEVTVIAHYLRYLGVLSAITERVRFVRRRFGHYDLMDFAVVLLGYAISGERTLEEYYERCSPLLPRLWLSLDENASLIAQRSVAFSPR